METRGHLADPELRRDVEKLIRARVPPAEVDDLVQETLADAIASKSAPDEREALRRWVFGIARHKIADFFRTRREQPISTPEVAAESAPHSAKELARWVDKVVPESARTEQTLEWMAREADGEKLESIAEDEKVPAPRVRQRVARLRRTLRERWKAELGIAAFLAVTIALVVWLARRESAPTIAEDRPDAAVADPRLEQAKELRRLALQDCASDAWDACINRLDEAKVLDAAGDRAENIQRARKAAEDALRLPPSPSPSASASSSSSSPSPSSSPSAPDAARRSSSAPPPTPPTATAPSLPRPASTEPTRPVPIGTTPPGPTKIDSK